MTSEIITLIKDYIKQVSIAVDLLTNKVQEKNIMRAWREKRIPQQGVIKEGLTYELHGIGCTFIFPDYELDFDFDFDFDFDYDNRIDGFDYWKLRDFVSQFPNKYEKYQDAEALKKDFDLLLNLGILYKINENSSLFHLR